MSKTLSLKNEVIVASAGSRKTTLIVERALSLRDKKTLIVTYTNENLDQIRSYLIEKNGHIPKNITILSWYTFLLQDGVRPYQSLVTERGRICSIYFADIPVSASRVKKSDVDRYYLTKNNNIYRDRVADFVCQVDDTTKELVVRRLERIYDCIFIDEFQDLAAYDLNIVDKLFNSSISIVAVGDPRQSTFRTNNSAKNSKYKKSGILDWIAERQKKQLVAVTEMGDCFRCNQAICDFADSLYPGLPKTNSKNNISTDHDGVFCIETADVTDYVAKYSPVVLRNNKSVNTMNLPAINIGMTKGRTYDRVLIFPTKPMIEYFFKRNVKTAGDIARLYVAVTRAKHSVAFVR